MYVGPYRVEQVLGRGGMGTVHRGVHRLLGTPVALKELTHTDPHARALFLDEARLLFGLKHPLFPTVLDALEAKGRTWLVMDFVDGPTLNQLCSHGPLTTEQAMLLGRGLCTALTFLHGRGVLHRDIKPDNILLPQGLSHPVLVDLGIAARKGTTGALAFTPGMASPEQVAGNPCTPASDVYQVGATLVTALCGAPPQDAALRQPGDDPLPAGIAPHLATVLGRALAWNAADRPASAAALDGLLQQARSFLPPAANAAAPVVTVRPQRRMDIRR